MLSLLFILLPVLMLSSEVVPSVVALCKRDSPDLADVLEHYGDKCQSHVRQVELAAGHLDVRFDVVETGHRFKTRDFRFYSLWYGTRNKTQRFEHIRFVEFTLSDQAVYAAAVGMKGIVTQLETGHHIDGEAGSDTQGKPQQINQCAGLVFIQIPEGEFDVVLDHSAQGGLLDFARVCYSIRRADSFMI